MQNVFENSLLEHRVCLPPGAMGKITYVAPHGNYSITEKVLEVEFQGQKKTFTMMHVSGNIKNKLPRFEELSRMMPC